MTLTHSPSALILQHESAIRILRGALQHAPLFAATAKQLIAEHARAIQELKAQAQRENEFMGALQHARDVSSRIAHKGQA